MQRGKVVFSLIVVFPLWFSGSLWEQGVGAESSPTSALVGQVREACAGIKDYAALMYYEEIKGDKSQRRVTRTYFGSPWNLRIEGVEGTEFGDAGSQAIYDGGPKIYGHQGGPLRFVNLKLKYDGKLVTSLLNLTFKEITLDAMLNRLNRYAEHGTISIDREDRVNGVPLMVLRLESSDLTETLRGDRVANLGITHEEVSIDKEKKIPRAWSLYKGHERIRYLSFESLRTNVGLDPAIFEKVKLKRSEREGLAELFPPDEYRPVGWKK